MIITYMLLLVLCITGINTTTASITPMISASPPQAIRQCCCKGYLKGCQRHCRTNKGDVLYMNRLPALVSTTYGAMDCACVCLLVAYAAATICGIHQHIPMISCRFPSHARMLVMMATILITC